MQPADSTLTCASCGAQLAAPNLPSPYCGQLAVPAPAPAVAAMAPPPVFPGAASYQAGGPWPPSGAPTWPAAPGPGPAWARFSPPPTIVVRRRSSIGCVLAFALLILVVVAVPIYFTFVAFQATSQAISSIPNLAPVFSLTPEDPVTAATQHIGQLTGYMLAGRANQPEAAYALYIHEAGWDAASRDDIAAEFQQHREHYDGFKALVPVDFNYVKVFGGPSYYRVRAQATYADGTTRPVEADLAQKSGWHLIQVKFTDKP